MVEWDEMSWWRDDWCIQKCVASNGIQHIYISNQNNVHHIYRYDHSDAHRIYICDNIGEVQVQRGEQRGWSV